MTDSSESSDHECAAPPDFNVQARIDALQSGDCTEEEFLGEIATLRESAPNLVWTILALIDQRYRRGLLAGAVFRSIKSKIARRELEHRDDGRTVELHPTKGFAPRVTEVPLEALGVEPDASVPQPEHNQGTALSAAAEAAPATSAPQSTATPQGQECGPILANRYSLGSVLGRGGMGTVYKALDRHRWDLPQENRYVALKVLDEGTTRRPELVADLRREFYCTQALAHPNIVKVYEMHHDNEVAFYTMELLEGQLLSELLQRVQPQALDRQYAWAIIRDVGAALAHAHMRSVVHGDLKPQNIIITDNGEVRILDFGASGTSTWQWETSDPLQRNRLPPVTLAYACCELLDGQQTDPRDDLYALACLSYELLAGEHPFERRRSTEARELGLQPRRPPGLTERQWHALQLGLSWRRESRSLPVREWLGMLGIEPPLERLPSLRTQAAPVARTITWRHTAVRAAALLLPVLAGLSWWGLRHSRNAVGTAPPVREAQLAPRASIPAPEGEDLARSDPAPAPAVAATLRPVQAAVSQPPEPVVQAHSQVPSDSLARGAAVADWRPAAAASQITLAADTYRVRFDEHFAEIDVRRSTESRGKSSFVWWTEPASARPGSDFVAQNRTTQVFLNGRRWAKLFIRIIPNPSRTRTEMFYVKIGEPSAGSTMGPVTRAAILLPPPVAGRDVTATIASAQQPLSR